MNRPRFLETSVAAGLGPSGLRKTDKIPYWSSGRDIDRITISLSISTDRTRDGSLIKHYEMPFDIANPECSVEYKDGGEDVYFCKLVYAKLRKRPINEDGIVIKIGRNTWVSISRV